MSIIHVNQIASKIKEIFADKINMSDVPDRDPEKEVKLLTRSLAAYAIYNHAACTPEEAANSVTDGGDDNGIDAVFYSQALRELIIVQSKWIKSGSGEPDSSEILKFCTGVEDLININFDRFNSKISTRQNEIITAMSDFDTKYIIILVYTGDKGIAEHGQRRINDLITKLNDAGDSDVEQLVKFKKLDQAKIYTNLSKGLLSDPLNIEVGLHQWGKYSDPFLAYYGYVSGEEILKLWDDSGRKLFNKNIRNVLKKTDVNDELQATIHNNPEKFWYFNNGITIIADKIEKSMIGGTNNDLGSFKLKNASVVNGAQTISSIGEIGSKYKEQIKKIFVLTRCISLHDTPVEFGNEVTKCNNRQNRIENRDFVSQDLEQIRLKEELAHDGITYNITRTNQFVKSKTAFDVEEATTSLACASGQVSLTVQAKRELGKYYESLTKGIYKQIFNPSTTGRYLLNCLIINRQIENLIAQKIDSLGKKSGKEYGILVHGNRMIASLSFDKITVSKTDIMDVYSLNIDSIFSDTLNKMSIAVTSQFSDNFLATLFKNKTKCDTIKDLCS
jgi:hypothetical protein